MASQEKSKDKESFLEAAKSARIQRHKDSVSSVKIQAAARGFLVRTRLRKEILEEFDSVIPPSLDLPDASITTFDTSAVQVYQVIRKFLFVYRGWSTSRMTLGSSDRQRFDRLCKYILGSMLYSKEASTCYIVVSMDKSHSVSWIGQYRRILTLCTSSVRELKPESNSDHKSMVLYLNMLVILTNTGSWKFIPDVMRPVLNQLCNKTMNHLVSHGLFLSLQILLQRGLNRMTPCLKKTDLSAIITLSMRPLFIHLPNTQGPFSDFIINLYLLHILSVPALLHHLQLISPDALTVLKVSSAPTAPISKGTDDGKTNSPKTNSSKTNSPKIEPSSPVTSNLLTSILSFLGSEQNVRILLNVLEGNYGLCLLANVIHLSYVQLEIVQSQVIGFVTVIHRLLECCGKYVAHKKSSLTHWHLIMGWFSQREDQGMHDSLVHVKRQLSFLWSPEMIRITFSPLIEYVDRLPSSAGSSRRGSVTVAKEVRNDGDLDTSDLNTQNQSSIRRAFGRAASVITRASEPITQTVITTTSTLSSTSMSIFGTRTGTSSGTGSSRRLASPEVACVSLICSMYTMALGTLTQIKLEILSGLCSQDIILPYLWSFISSLGPKNGLSPFLDHLTFNSKTCSPEFQILVLFCDSSTHNFTILDDIEMYEHQKPFSLQELITISSFLNQFIFRIIWNNLVDLKTIQKNTLFNSLHSFLMILYSRNSRRSFTPKEHWLIREIKMSVFLRDLENKKKPAELLLSKVAHVIPHKERVVLFRKNVGKEKTVLGISDSACSSSSSPSTLITVHRLRIVEDGYEQLARLPSQSLKGFIRVKFINEQGLDEAGIDQDGVFKEFLEETLKRVFDPSLNLFRTTSDEQRLYPSPTSYIQENHLELFEFIGKVLGKAVYEGIVVDVPFASFFLSQVLGHQSSSALYSSIDELPSLDPELYKSLTYIKRYEGDVSDLGLTFSIDEDVLGQIVTYELVPGGRSIPVTEESKISYIHSLAHFKMHLQIKDQTNSFIRGFRSLINPDWLSMFSTPELQRLISGDNAPIDLIDLRRNTKYYGGFHNNHRVISWLWDILEKDFTPDEHRCFLKFVTSCSKPPLLGFSNLEPPFSIRCVEVGDDQDSGDTVGSVLRGFFTIRKKDPINRLPTSSTCFNLLKLPNYQKRITLRDKLRYAITSNTGFELS